MATGSIGGSQFTSDKESRTLDVRRGIVSFVLSVEQHITLLHLEESFPNWPSRQAKAGAVHYGHKWVEIHDEMKARYPELNATKGQLQSLCVRGRKKRRLCELEERVRLCEERKPSTELAAMDNMEKELASCKKTLEESTEEKNKILGLFHESEQKVQEGVKEANKVAKDLANVSKVNDDLKKENDDLKVKLTVGKKENDDLKAKRTADKKKIKLLLAALTYEEKNDEEEKNGDKEVYEL